MKTSPAGIALIKKFEGCELTAYRDVVGVWSIGYGDTLNVREGMRISQQEAEDRLASRLAREFEPGVMAALQGAQVTQTQFDAMISLAWNIGVGAFKGSTLARLHRAGDYAGAADEFQKWDRAGGRVLDALLKRREEERALYLSGGANAPVCTKPDNSPSVCTDIDRDLIADLVRALQRVVDADPDGRMGPKTYEAVLQMQRQAS